MLACQLWGSCYHLPVYFILETGYYYVALAVLKLTMYTRLALSTSARVLGLKARTTTPAPSTTVYSL